MNEMLFMTAYALVSVFLYLLTAILSLFGFLIVPIISVWIGLGIAELLHLPFAGTLRKLWQKWVIIWPLKKLGGLVKKIGSRLFGAAWRGFVIVMRRLGAAAWRGFVIVIRDIWSRIRGTP